MIKVLIVDEDLDSHELLNDVLHVYFHEVEVERALDSKSLISKISQPEAHYDLILLSSSIAQNSKSDLWEEVQKQIPDIWDKTVLMVGAHEESYENPPFNQLPQVSKPFSLDHFAEIIKKTLAV